MNNNTVVEKIVDYIETHINEDLSLDKIANALNYSKFYIARNFLLKKQNVRFINTYRGVG